MTKLVVQSDTESCAGCRFFRESTPGFFSGTPAHCVRFPPFTETQPEFWCGEWQGTYLRRPTEPR